MLVVYIVIFLYGLYKLFFGFNNQLFEANILMISNLVIIICLIFARFNIQKVLQGRLMEVNVETEDTHQVTLERTAYTATTFIQIALSLSFIALLVGFLLLRDTQPVIVLWSAALMVVSFASLFPSKEIVSVTNPTFKFPDRSEEHTSELQSRFELVCRLLLEKNNKSK